MVAGFFTSSSNGFGILEHPGGDYYRNDGGWSGIGDVVPEGNTYFKITIRALPSNQVYYRIERPDQITREETISNSISNE